MNVLTIIPARGGSKGVPGKNIRPVHGKPLMAWTIECALAVRGLERIVVSSDDPAILDVARAYPRIVARERPAEHARDNSLIAPAVAHILAEDERETGAHYDAILLLQATAPLREAFHVEEALGLLRDGVNTVISVCAMRDMHPARMYRMQDDRELVSLMPELEQARRQDIAPVYYRNGSIYLVRRDAFDATGSLMAKPAVGYEMEDRYLLNIDEPRDMLIAEPLIAAWKGTGRVG